MHLRNDVLRVAAVLIVGILSASSLYAGPNTSVKNRLIREKNLEKGSRTSPVLPYRFFTESLSVTLGVGGGMKGYGRDQMLVGATGFASFDEAIPFNQPGRRVPLPRFFSTRQGSTVL